MLDIIDPFVYSTTLRLIPTSYRANVLAQMEILRRAKAYKARYYTAPDDLVEPIPAYGQVETQIRAIAGTYIWGISLFESAANSKLIRVQVVDTSTEIRLFVDYIQSALMAQATSSGIHHPMLLSQPRLISEPGQINVEIYNDNATTATVQLVLYCAEPVPPNPDIHEANHYQKYERLS